MRVAPINECPHCHSDEGYYTNNTYRGKGITRFNFDGSEAENDDMYDCLTDTESKYVYCLCCNKRLFKTEEISPSCLFR